MTQGGEAEQDSVKETGQIHEYPADLVTSAVAMYNGS